MAAMAELPVLLLARLGNQHIADYYYYFYKHVIKVNKSHNLRQYKF